MKGTPLKSSTAVLLPPAPSLLTALRLGFDAIANHMFLILFPIALDLLLWLGPRISLTRLIRSFVEQMLAVNSVQDEQLVVAIRALRELWMQLADQFNLLVTLRTFPVGISSLFASRLVAGNPLGIPNSVEITSLGGMILAWLLLGVLGLALGSLYFGLVAQVALHGRIGWRETIQDWRRTTIQILYLTLFWTMLVFVLTLPVSFFISLSMLGLSVAQCLILVYLCFVAWLVIPLFFSPHGIFVLGQNMRNSLRTSAIMTRRTMPMTMPFIGVILVLSFGLNYLWATPAETSWWMVVGVIGHAFVTTALLAATFVYYRDAERWTSRVYPLGGLSGKS